MIVRSMARLQMLRARRKLTRLPHFPGSNGCQNLAVGRHIKKELMTIPAPKLMTATFTAYAALRNALLERKTVM